jgi:2-dehydro-3-deoxygluconokinase
MNRRVVCFGELMMRLHAPDSKRFVQSETMNIYYGGSEANVAVLLAQLGISSSLVTRLPQNELGQAAIHAIHRYGVDISFVVRGGDRLGLYFTETSPAIRPSKVIYDRQHSSFSSLQPGMVNWGVVFENSSWFHWSGISAAVSQGASDVCLEALKAAKKAGLKISADLNYRSLLWKYGKKPSEVMPELLSYCDVLVGDLDSVELYFGIPVQRSMAKTEAMNECGVKLMEKLPSLEMMAMTFRESAQGLLYSGALLTRSEFSTSKVWELGSVVERIGSGDAFTGGLIFALLQKESTQRVIDLAVASGAFKHSIPGEFNIISQAELEATVMSGNVTGRIIR